jgi:hypothetical protein
MNPQDRNDVKGQGEPQENQPWGNIRPEPIELEAYQNQKRSRHSETLPIWAQVMIGVLAAGAVMFIGRELYDRYQLYQLQKFLEQQTAIWNQQEKAARRQTKIEAENFRQKLEQQRKDREAKREATRQHKLETERRQLADRKQQEIAAAQQKKLMSDDCRFWTENYLTYRTDKSKEKRDEYCTLSRIERAVITAKY